MSNNVLGFKYEKEVISAIKKAGVCGNITEGAGANSHAGDADIRIRNKIYPIEVKLNRNAQMGGSSLKYSKNRSLFKLVSEVEPEIEDLLLQTIKKEKRKLNQLLSFIQNEYDKSIVGFPFVCPKAIWSAAAENNLLVNTKIRTNIDFITGHYNKKNIYYIQIGKSGLFYLNKNPAKLPVPKLEGDINIEIRTGRSGSRKLKSGEKVVTGAIRVQGRLKTKNKSPYTLDSVSSIKTMLNLIEK